jgi:hypothetical protein
MLNTGKTTYLLKALLDQIKEALSQNYKNALKIKSNNAYPISSDVIEETVYQLVYLVTAHQPIALPCDVQTDYQGKYGSTCLVPHMGPAQQEIA